MMTGMTSIPEVLGFLYKDDTINGKIKYSLDAKLSNDLFSGIYQYDSKGKLVIYGNWHMDGFKDCVFIEIRGAQKIVIKKKEKNRSVKKKAKKKKSIKR